MYTLRGRQYFRLLTLFIFILGYSGLVHSQNSYSVTHYTSKQGLPQNSVRGLAFDHHGFLWLATEGGLARFNGQSFRIYNSGDLSGLNNQRFTHALTCMDSSILIIDQLNGMYRLANDQITTLQASDVKNVDISGVIGSLPYPAFIIKDSFFMEELLHVRQADLIEMSILPQHTDKVYMISDRVVVLDLLSHDRLIVQKHIAREDRFAMLQDELLKFNMHGQIFRLQPATNSFEPCVLTDEVGRLWPGFTDIVKVYNKSPFEDVLINDGHKLYRLIPTKDRSHFIIHTLLDALPENCFINDVADRPSDDVLVLGTDSRGMFVYKRKYFNTFLNQEKNKEYTNSYYAECLVDSSTMLASNGLLIDVGTNKVKGHFPYPFNANLLCSGNQDFFMYTRGANIFRYNNQKHKSFPIWLGEDFNTNCITLIDSTVWIGTTLGVGYIVNDSLHWVRKTANRGGKYGIKSIALDVDHHLWYGSYFQLYRLDLNSHQVDSFPLFENADCRALELIRGKLFIGTYGKGYYVYDHGRFVHMPGGRNNELSNTHTFVEDPNGYLWITTNRGLYKTQLDAVDAFIRDTTLSLDYYVYLEEDGIQNTEFNGGCSPAHLWLPDGRLSLPTIEGLVMFRPKEVPHYFPKDSVVIESIEADKVEYRWTSSIKIPANHTDITIHFASAWWNQPYNQYISYQLEEMHNQFLSCDQGQSSYTIGHLKPGQYTFVIRRRCGFGSGDFVYSRLLFTVATPWYAKSWAYVMFGIGFVMAIWGTSILYTRSIKQRNVELQKKVDDQTTALLKSNETLEKNLSQLSRSEIILKENIRTRDRLISIITHDILTPLRFIGKIATLGAEDKPADLSLPKRALTDVQNAVQKLFHSTQNLLHWVTYQQEQFKTTSANCSPFALVEQLFQDFFEMSQFQNNTLINEVPEDDVILTDPRILNIVLHNLLSNAIKYTQQGSVKVQSSVEHHWYVLEVSDTGRGMTMAQLESIRRSSTQQEAASLNDITAGNGIGLSLVSELMQALGGKWEIDSPNGAGVRVRIFLSLGQHVAV